MESTKGVSTYHFSEETAGAKKNDTLARKPFDLRVLPRWSSKEKTLKPHHACTPTPSLKSQ